MQYTITFSERELAILIASVADKYQSAINALTYVRGVAEAHDVIDHFCTEISKLNGKLIDAPPDN